MVVLLLLVLILVSLVSVLQLVLLLLSESKVGSSSISRSGRELIGTGELRAELSRSSVVIRGLKEVGTTG